MALINPGVMIIPLEKCGQMPERKRQLPEGISEMPERKRQMIYTLNLFLFLIH